MPPDELKAFKELKAVLLSEPVMANPQRNRPYCLITVTALGDSDQKKPGGLDAILMQTDDKGRHHVLACAIQKLEKAKRTSALSFKDASWCLGHGPLQDFSVRMTLHVVHGPQAIGKVM